MCSSNDDNSIDGKKAALRKDVLIKLKNFSKREEESLLIVKEIKALRIYQEASLILAFYPLATEPNIKILLSDPRVALPFIDNNEMFFSKSKKLIKSRLGFLEPEHNPIKIEKALMLTPLVAFDKRLYRLGRGGGFYDRFISQNRENLTIIGLAFSPSLVETTFHQEFDQKLDHVICPTFS